MAENFNLIFGSQAPETASWSDADYQTGWNTVGSTPPTAEQFDFLQNRADKKAQELYNRLTPLEQKAQEQGRQAGTAYTAGASATVDGLPADWLLVCTTAGISGTSAVVLPDPLVDGATITDGTITWTLRKLATNGALGYRQPSTSYALGAVAHNAGLPTGTYLECTTAGQTGSGELTITSPTVGGTVSDGTVTWTVRKNASTQDLTDYLPLSGGSIANGAIDVSAARIIITKNIHTTADAHFVIKGGELGGSGSSLELFGPKNSDSEEAGSFKLSTKNGISFRGLVTGDLLWNGNSLDKSAVVAESLGINGYRKYASGLIEQWGSLDKIQANISKNVTFPIAFTSQVKITASVVGVSPSSYLAIEPHNSYFLITCSSTQAVMWSAIGY